MTDTISEGPSFRIERSRGGATLVSTGPWTAEAAAALRSGQAEGLDLNYAKGFKDTALSFIEDWPLKRVTLLARTVKDLKPLQRLATTLEFLAVQSAPTALIDLAKFPNVTDLSASWVQIRDSMEAAPQLEEVFTLSYTDENLTPLRFNTRLRRVRMKDRPRLRSLLGVDQLPALEDLGIFLASSLTDIEPVASATTLQELHLESCRGVNDLTPLTTLRALRLLNLSECGDIASLASVSALRNLEIAWLYGSTNITDDDLTPLADLPRLAELRMKSRRSYQPSVEQIQAAIALRR